MTIRTEESQAATQAALNEFAAGLDGKHPDRRVVEMAARIANAALLKTVKQDISFDDEECAVSFDLELSNGHLILAELWYDGSIDASVYDEKSVESYECPMRRKRRYWLCFRSKPCQSPKTICYAALSAPEIGTRGLADHHRGHSRNPVFPCGT